ncbi:MAG: hypothetical protein M3256_19725 [Actinomycetota bacterium]|nr:hypothetical protein [Actinomycetota bacterium]
MTRLTCRSAVFGFSVLVAVTMQFGTAYAAVFNGSMTVTMTAHGSGTSSGIGSNNAMGLCGGAASAGASGVHGTGVFKIDVAAATCGSSFFLPNNTYDVNFLNRNTSTITFPFTQASGSSYTLDPVNGSCMSGFGRSPGTVNLGTLTVSGGAGVGHGTGYVIPSSAVADGSTHDSAVCVSDSADNYGMEVPINVTTI